MDEHFFTAKNGSTICSKNDLQLHSMYNPQKEAERFVESLETPFVPQYVIVTGASLPYCVPFLRKRFPTAKLGAIQYSPAFSNTDSSWDFVLICNKNTSLHTDLFSIIGEEDSATALFVSWKPSEAAYPAEYAVTWAEIKQFVSTARDVLATRMFFNKRWLKNTIKFCCSIQNAYIPRKKATDIPIVLVASGPTLQKMLPALVEYRDYFYLFAVSSAIAPLVSYGITPDFCISTDGGWWAKEHLKFFSRCETDFPPLLAPAESAVPHSVLVSHAVVPLSYGDGIESLLLQMCHIPCFPASRNGTVSGTAAQLALALTTGDVLCCGLDLTTSQGFQHCQPNELEYDSKRFDTRLAPLETRTAGSSFTSGALAIYADWFSSRQRSFYSRFIRIAHSDDTIKTHLKNIEEITHTQFISRLTCTKQGSPLFERTELLPTEKRFTIIKEYVCNIKKKLQAAKDAHIPVKQLDDELVLWLKTLALGDFLTACKHNQTVSDAMQDTILNVFTDVQRILVNDQ